MITKEKIIEILSKYSSYADSSLGNIIQEEKHDIIAEDIMSKLRQPTVSCSLLDDKWKQYRNITNNEDAWCFKEWLKSNDH